MRPDFIRGRRSNLLRQVGPLGAWLDVRLDAWLGVRAGSPGQVASVREPGWLSGIPRRGARVARPGLGQLMKNRVT